MGKFKRLLSNMAILGIGTFASKVLVFLLMPFYTSVLSTEQFGVADILTQTANLLIPLAAVGICDGIFRFALDSSEDGEISERRVLSGGVAVLALGSAACVALVQILRVFDIFDGYVWLVAAYVLCANLHSAFANFLRAKGHTVLFAIQGIINTALTIGLNILFLVVFDMGTLGYVLSVVVADLCVTVFLFFVGRLYRYLSVKEINARVVGKMLRFSIPYIPTTILWLITSVSDRYIVTAYCGEAENGLYAAAYKLPTMLSLVCGVFIEAWHFSTVKDAEPEERSAFFGIVFKNYMGIIFMGASGIIAFSKILTRLLLADSYYSSWSFVPVLTIATAVSALVSFLGSVYFIEKKSTLSMLTAMSGAVVNVLLNFVMIPRHGAMGAAVATLISYIAVYAIRAYDTRFYIRFNMHTVKVIVNFFAVCAQAVLMIAEVPYWQYVQAAFVVFMLIFNVKDIVKGVFGVIKQLKNKKIKKT